jgi:hypothetical protein
MPYPSPGMEIQGIKTEFHIFVYTDKKVSLEMSIHKTINQF